MLLVGGASCRGFEKRSWKCDLWITDPRGLLTRRRGGQEHPLHPTRKSNFVYFLSSLRAQTDKTLPLPRGQKINANFFCTKFFDNPSGHGHPGRKSWTSAPKSAFSCVPGGGEKLFDPWASGRKGQECPREIRTKKFMFMLFFLP